MSWFIWIKDFVMRFVEMYKSAKYVPKPDGESPLYVRFRSEWSYVYSQRKAYRDTRSVCFPATIATYLEGYEARSKNPGSDWLSTILKTIDDNKEEFDLYAKKIAPRKKYKPRNLVDFWRMFLPLFIRSENGDFPFTMRYIENSKKSIEESLKNKLPVIVTTKLTRRGHVVLIVGTTDRGYLIFDPNGKFPYRATFDKYCINSYEIKEKTVKPGWAAIIEAEE